MGGTRVCVLQGGRAYIADAEPGEETQSNRTPQVSASQRMSARRGSNVLRRREKREQYLGECDMRCLRERLIYKTG